MKQQLVRGVAPGALALFAVMTMGTSTAQAASPDGSVSAPAACGQPAVPAVFESVVHEPVLETVPAVTRLDRLWTRDVALTEVSYSRVMSPLYAVIEWTRSVDVLLREFARTVVDQPYQPATPDIPAVGHTESRVVTEAVVVTEYEFVQQRTGNTRWEAEGWNAGAGGLGWAPTGVTRVVELSPAVTEQVWIIDQPAVPGTPEVPEVSHVETTWLDAGGSVPTGYLATGATRVVGSQVVETVSLPDGETPSGTGWVRGGVVGVVDAVVDVVWLPEGEPAPAGYTSTGDARPAGFRTETTTVPQELAPAGPGWAPVPGSELVVEVEPERTVEVTAGYVETVLVSPAVPATAPCVIITPVENGPADGDPDVEGPGVDGPGADGPADDGGVSGGPAADASDVGGPSAGVVGQLLPATGSEVSLWLVGAGLGSLAGGGLLLTRRRREDLV